MRAFKHNPHPIDIKDFYRAQLKVVDRKEAEREERDEEYTEAPAPAPSFRSNLLKLRRSFSEKLFSIEFGRISF